MMTNNTKLIQDYLDEILPEASCELTYSKPYELVIAVMLSAQTTDKAVNKVTDILFAKFNSLEKLANASYDDIYSCIKCLGLAKNKTNNVIAISKYLLNDCNGIVPKTKDELMKMEGVGNKTAGVILAEIYKLPNFPVDTHIKRISYRLKLSNKNDQPIDVEKKLKKVFPESCWIKLHHQFIHFGRYICLARNPKCENCKLCSICREKHCNN